MKQTAVPLVLIHGVGLDHSMWLPVMSALPGRRIIAYDMIGHGGARRPAGPYTLDMFVDQLASIVEAVNSEIDLVGFSMGALVAQGFALSTGGQRIQRMVLFNAVHDRTADERQAIVHRVAEVRATGPGDTVEPALQRWFTTAFAEAHGDVVDSIRRCLHANDPRSYADAYEVFAIGRTWQPRKATWRNGAAQFVHTTGVVTRRPSPTRWRSDHRCRIGRRGRATSVIGVPAFRVARTVHQERQFDPRLQFADASYGHRLSSHRRSGRARVQRLHRSHGP